MAFKESIEALDTLSERIDANSGRRGTLERSVAISVSYYNGQQMIQSMPRRRADAGAPLWRLRPDISPDSAKVRVTANRTTQYTQKSVVATFPEKFDVECLPPPRDAGEDAMYRCQCAEDLLMTAIQSSGFTSTRRDVNHQRGVMGTYGLGLRVRRKTRTLRLYSENVSLPESEVETFGFTPLELTTDPFCYDRVLSKHEWVIHHSLWSVPKANVFFGTDFDAKGCRTIGDLAPWYMAMNRLTDGYLYQEYANASTTRGVICHTMYEKDPDGRWTVLYVIEGSGKRGLKDDRLCLNLDDQTSPFGGNGLGLCWYHGHRRGGEGPYGISDPAMLKDDQDRLNLTETSYHRQSMRSAGWQHLIDQNSLPDKKDKGAGMRAMLSNTVGGMILYDGGTKEDPHQAPKLVQYPGPDASLIQQGERCERKMMDQVHRTDVTSGKLKSHTSEGQLDKALEQSGQVLGSRVVEDIEVDNEILATLLGTYIKLVQQHSPCILNQLTRLKFDEMDLGTIAEMDPDVLECTVKVKDGSVRYRSPDARRAELSEAMVNKTLPPDKIRRALVNLDMALDDEDRLFSRQCDRIAMEVVRGKPFEPMFLGEYGSWMLSALRRALVSPIALKDPAVRQALNMAIQSQVQAMAQENQLMQPQPPVDAAAGAGSEGADVGDVAFDQLVSSLSAGGAGSASPPMESAEAA